MTYTRIPRRSPHALSTRRPASPSISLDLESRYPFFDTPAPSRAYRITKRSLDVTLAATGLVVFSPVLAAVALAIKLDSPGSVLCRQKRIGLYGRSFDCFKFRSMRSDADKLRDGLAHLNERKGPVFKIKNDPRITRLGRFLRKYSVDELPQLINVLRGEMSLVGPRPPLPNEVAQYETHHFRRLEVIPGITGLQQVCARDHPDFEEWVRLDVEYIENRGIGTDLKILLRTPLAVFSGKGAC